MHNLLIDIGNTATKVALDATDLPGHEMVTIASDHDHIDEVLNQVTAEIDVQKAAISAVVPSVLKSCEEWLRDNSVESVVVSEKLNLPFKMGYRTPATLGADRIAGAAGALNYCRTVHGESYNVVSVDAGTAVTFDFVSKDNVFLGGPIAAGPELLRRALSGDTAQLPDVQLFMPDGIIAGSSEDAVRAGIMIGFVEGCCGILRRIVEQAEGDTIIVFSGGWGQLLADEWSDESIYRPTTLFDGLTWLLENNQSGNRD